MLQYFRGDLDGAERIVASLRPMALAPAAPARMLDVVTLEGLIAHNRGEWFDKLRREISFAEGSLDLTNTLFDAQVCVAEYVIHGPMPRGELVRLAGSLAETAERIGSRPGLAFARTLIGELEYLAGDLETARASLEEALQLYREMSGETGEAHLRQRLAEVALASGDREAAEMHARRALALARWSPIGHHILQRTLGTLILAAPDSESALARAREASGILDEPGACLFCEVMSAVPMAVAFAAGGDLGAARERLAAAERSARLWEGEAWDAAVTEARARIALAEGEVGTAIEQFHRAAAGFELADRPLDAARCREAALGAHG